MNKNLFKAFLLFSLFSATSYADVKGTIDWAKSYSGEYYISGWACEVGSNASIKIHILAGGPAGSGEFVKAYNTGLPSETAVSDACSSNGKAHRFKVPFTKEEQRRYLGKKLYVHGISSPGKPNSLLTNSGKFSMRFQTDEFTDNTLFRRTFDPKPSVLWAEDYLSVISQGGNNILKASYVPYDRGSKRILERFAFSSTVKKATLEFDVKFDQNFEFVKGGKLHGLGGGSATTGCAAVDPEGWSVRIMWNRSGVPYIYVYDQDRTSRCGRGLSGHTRLELQKNVWHRLSLFVQLNSAPYAYDGVVKLSVDGKEVSNHAGLRLTGSQGVNIDSFLFSTFHGGSTVEWAPSRTVYAYYDNFTVTKGYRNSGDSGQICELQKEGITNGDSLCCSESCGSCGGKGCGGLLGGASACCSGTVEREAEPCFQSDSAPCSF